MGLGTAIARRFLAYSVTIMAPPAITSSEKMSTATTTTTAAATTTSSPLSKKGARAPEAAVAVANCYSGEKVNGSTSSSSSSSSSVITGLTLNGGGTQPSMILNGKSALLSPETLSCDSIASTVTARDQDNCKRFCRENDNGNRSDCSRGVAAASVSTAPAVVTVAAVAPVPNNSSMSTFSSSPSSCCAKAALPSLQSASPLPSSASAASLPALPLLSSSATNDSLANGVFKCSNDLNGALNRSDRLDQSNRQHEQQQQYSVNADDTESLIKIEKNEFETFFDSVLSSHKKETKAKLEWNNDGALDNKDDATAGDGVAGSNGAACSDHNNYWNSRCGENGLALNAAVAAAAAAAAINHTSDDLDTTNVEDVLQVLKSMESKASACAYDRDNVDDVDSAAVPFNSMVPSCAAGSVGSGPNGSNGCGHVDDSVHEQLLLPNDDLSDLLFMKLNGDDDMFAMAAAEASMPLHHQQHQQMDCSGLQGDSAIVDVPADEISEESIQTSISLLRVDQNQFENRLNSLQKKLRFMQCKVLGQIGCREIEYFLSYMHDRTKFQSEAAAPIATRADASVASGRTEAGERASSVIDAAAPEPTAAAVSAVADRIPKFDMKKFIKIYDLPSMMTSMKSTIYNKQRQAQQRPNGVRNLASGGGNMAVNHAVLASMLTSQSAIASGTSTSASASSSTSTRMTAASSRQAAAAAATAAAGNYFHTIVNHAVNFMEFSPSLPNSVSAGSEIGGGSGTGSTGSTVTVSHSNQLSHQLSALSHSKSVNIIRPKLVASSQQTPLSFPSLATTATKATSYSSSLPLKSIDVSFLKQQQKAQLKRIPPTSGSVPLLSLAPAAASASASITSPAQPVELAKLNVEQSADFTQTASTYCSQLNRILSDIDSDKTESSSDAESCDEMQNYQNIYQQSVPIKERSAWHYARERARIGSRWSWTESQLADVSNRIRQINEQIQEVGRLYGSVKLESASAIGASVSATTSTCTNQNTAAAALNSNCSLEESFLTHFQNSNNSDDRNSENEDSEPSRRRWRLQEQPQQHQELASAQSARTKVFQSSNFRKRKLISMYGLHQQSKKISKPSTVRCFCQPPYTYCVICTGRVDPKLSKDDFRSSLFPDDNIELLDHHYHKSLSTLQDVSQNLHLESITKYSEWQQRVLKGGLKLHKIPKKDAKMLAAATIAAAAAAAANSAASGSSTTADHLSGMSGGTSVAGASKYPMPASSKVRKTDHFPPKRKYIRHVRNSKIDLQRRSKVKNRKLKPGQYMSCFQNGGGGAGGGSCAGGGEGKSGHVRDPDDYEEEFEEYGSTGLNGHSSASHRRPRNNSYNIDNIVIPYSVAAATRVEVLQYKEIQTPRWRLTDKCFTDDPTKSRIAHSSTVCEFDLKLQEPSKHPDESDDEEVSDDTFSARHEICEEIEHKKFSNYLKFPVPTRTARHHQHHHGSALASSAKGSSVVMGDDFAQALSQSNSNDSFQCMRRSVSPSSCASPLPHSLHHLNSAHFGDEAVSSSSRLSSTSPSPLQNVTHTSNWHSNLHSKRKSASFQFDPNFCNMVLTSVDASVTTPYENVLFPIPEVDWTDIQAEKTCDEQLSLLSADIPEETDAGISAETVGCPDESTGTETAMDVGRDASETLESSVSSAVDANVSDVIQKSDTDATANLTLSKAEKLDVASSSIVKPKRNLPNGCRNSKSAAAAAAVTNRRPEDEDVDDEDDDDDVADQDYHEEEDEEADEDDEEEEEEVNIDEEDDDDEDDDEASFGDLSGNESEGEEIDDDENDENDEDHKDPEWKARSDEKT